VLSSSEQIALLTQAEGLNLDPEKVGCADETTRELLGAWSPWQTRKLLGFVRIGPDQGWRVAWELKDNFLVIQANILDFPMDKVSSKMMPLAIESAVDEMHELAAKEMSRGTKAAYRFMRDKSDDMLHDFVRDKMAREAREMVIPDLLSACKNKECDCKKANPLAALSTATELARLYAHFLAQFTDYIALLATGELSYAKVYEPAWKTVGFEPLTQSLSLNSSQS
jgi:hypothetical protein